MLTVLLLVLLGSLICVFIWERHRKMTVLHRSGIPGPKPHFLWGNMQECFSKPNVQWDTELLENYGPIAGYYLGAKPIIVTDDIAFFKAIQNFKERPRRVPGGISPDPNRKKMLANLNVEEWGEVRKVLTPGFSPKNLKAMLPQVSTLTDVFLQKVKSAEGTSVDFYKLFQGLTLDIIGRTGFGVDCNIQSNINDPVHVAVQEEFSKSPSSLLVKFCLAFPEFSWILQTIRRLNHFFRKKANALWKLGETIVQERQLLLSQGESRPDLLQLLVQKFAEHDPLKAVANAVLFFEAAYETMSSTMGFLVHFLVNDARIQEKLREEILGYLKDEDDPTGALNSFEFIEKLHYMSAVLDETLRILPPQTTFISRCGSEDFVYNIADGHTVTIPKGVHIQLGLYQVHRSANNFKDPDRFLPERFFQNTKKSFQAFQPFGDGPRKCIGERYSLLMIKMVIANLLFRFKLIPCPETESELQLKFKTATMTPLNGSYAQPISI